MHTYKIEMYLYGQKAMTKNFRTRVECNEYLEKVLTKNHLQVEEVYPRYGNEHVIEYVCDNYNHFVIARA